MVSLRPQQGRAPPSWSPPTRCSFATIPNAATIATSYQTSRLKQLVDSPNSQPVSDAVVKAIGQKNLDLLNAFLPNLSGQSFFAVTHFDADKPAEQVGIIAGMRPKAGMGSFDAFIAKLKATWPDVLKQGSTGTSNPRRRSRLSSWLQGPGGANATANLRGPAQRLDHHDLGHGRVAGLDRALPEEIVHPQPGARCRLYKNALASGQRPDVARLHQLPFGVLDFMQKQMAQTN